MGKSWEQRWGDIFRSLAINERLWNESTGSHVAVLEDFKKQALTEKSESLGTRPTVLHELAKDFNAGGFQAVPEQTRLEVMNYLIDHNTHHTEKTQTYDEQQEDPILEVAIRCDNKDFLQHIVDHCEDSLSNLLAARGPSGMNCLHYAFKSDILDAAKNSEQMRKKLATEKRLNRRAFLSFLQKFVQSSSDETATAQDRLGNTPIHYALAYELCRLPINWYKQKIVVPLVVKGDKIFTKHQHARQFNNVHESPYLYFKATSAAKAPSEAISQSRQARPDMEAKELLYGRFSTALDKNMFFDAAHQQGKTADEVVILVEKLSRAGGFEDTLSYVSLPSLDHVTDTSSGPVSESYTQNETRRRSPRDKAQTAPENRGRSSLVRVFDALSENNVRTILRLHVDDLDSPAHTDAAIERAIRGRDAFSLDTQRPSTIHIETWDWRKIDISIDVILFAAPDVVNVNLYWSGNWSVLSGWAGRSGIPRLYESGKKLKTVILHAFPGLESSERLTKMIDHFKVEIKDQTEDGVKLEVKRRTNARPNSARSDEDLGTLASGRSGPPQHVWVDRMEDFRRSLFNIHNTIPTVKNMMPPRIKVALIDDGVDLSSLDTHIVQATGLSYCPPLARNVELPWHQSTNGHGTIMANMIARINPWVSLDVMRIQDSMVYKPGAEGGMQVISALSAARAIDGARIRKADIISMSWSIRKPAKSKVAAIANGTKQTPEERDIEALQEAIDKARKDNILMFCSAADDIQIIGKDSLPFSRAPDYIFRIGAALPKGQRDPASEDANSISYFFPGNQVAEAWNPRSVKAVEYHDGSSVSTALAAGLASLIMYCNNVMLEYHRAATEWAKSLKFQANMRRAFDNISQKKEHGDKKFLPVWDLFGEATERMKSVKGERVMDELDDLVTKLCNNLEPV
ncbi:hypothetical protein F5Y10DRAFT_282592 [Nemania abortiva]|nr:hypothetical protein F5Y10DRAFT_282592 [Nemania abortiva]